MYLTSFFFFSSRRRHTRCSRDWSSDVCSSDLTCFRSIGETLRNRQRVPFPHECGGFLALVPVDDDQEFICANGRVATQGIVGHYETHCSVADPGAQHVCHVDGPSLNAIVGADDLKAIPVIAIAVAVPCGTVIPIIAARIHHAHVKHVHFHEAAFPVSKFALFILAISCDDAERLVGSHGGIPSHGLVGDRNPPIHAAASDEILKNIRDVVALVFEAVLRAHDLPAFFLCDHSGAKNAGANCEDDHSDDKHPSSICELHSRLLQGEGPPYSFSHFNPGGVSR